MIRLSLDVIILSFAVWCVNEKVDVSLEPGTSRGTPELSVTQGVRVKERGSMLSSQTRVARLDCFSIFLSGNGSGNREW